MTVTCRSCLLKDQKDYVSLLAVFPEFGKKSILDLLRVVTSSEIPYSENLPCELCSKCWKKLKFVHSFIVLFKNSQKILQRKTKILTERRKTASTVVQDLSVVELENMDYFLDNDSPERIVIVNDDGDTYKDIVQDIFGYEEQSIEKKYKFIEGQIEQSESIKCTDTEKRHDNVIMVTVEDVLKESLEQETFLKPNFSEKSQGINISYQYEDNISYKEEEDINAEQFYEISTYGNEEDTFSEPQEDETYSNNEADDMEDHDNNEVYVKMKTNQNRTMSNIQIVTIEDVLNSSRKEEQYFKRIPRSEEKNVRVNDGLRSLSRSESEISDYIGKEEDTNKRILSVEDVLKVKWKQDKTNDVSGSLSRMKTEGCDSTNGKDQENKIILSIEDVLKAKRWRKNTANGVSGTAQCDICFKTFDEFRKVRLHKYRTHNPTCIKCSICGIQSNTRSAHNKHLTQHINKRYPCDKCDKSYTSRSKMIEHVLRVHEKKHDNRYLCPECGKGFKFRNALQYHINKHTNSKNFICRYCGFACLVLSALKRHERVHTGERPYQCKHCSKTFAGAPEKQKHEFAHEGILRYKCKYCDKKFIQPYNMKVHWMQHKGPYACEMCKKAFTDAEILKFHYAHTHKIKNVIIEEDDEGISHNKEPVI